MMAVTSLLPWAVSCLFISSAVGLNWCSDNSMVTVRQPVVLTEDESDWSTGVQCGCSFSATEESHVMIKPVITTYENIAEVKNGSCGPLLYLDSGIMGLQAYVCPRKKESHMNGSFTIRLVENQEVHLTLYNPMSARHKPNIYMEMLSGTVTGRCSIQRSVPQKKCPCHFLYAKKEVARSTSNAVSAGGIAGIVIALIVFIILMILVTIYFIKMYQSQSQELPEGKPPEGRENNSWEASDDPAMFDIKPAAKTKNGPAPGLEVAPQNENNRLRPSEGRENKAMEQNEDPVAFDYKPAHETKNGPAPVPEDVPQHGNKKREPVYYTNLDWSDDESDGPLAASIRQPQEEKTVYAQIADKNSQYANVPLGNAPDSMV